MAFRDIWKWIVKKDVNFWPSILLMIFTGAVASEAYNLGLGNIHAPGPGFVIFRNIVSHGAPIAPSVHKVSFGPGG